MIFDTRCRRAKIILSFSIITFGLAIENSEAARDRGARCEKPDYISNGGFRIRRDRVMRITCNSGFLLQGPKTIDCIRGKWDGEKPVCAKKGCKKDLDQPENGRIQIENDVKAILYCSDNYNLAGNRHSYCNGSAWDRPIGNCRERKNIVQHECDFETDDICGWTYEPREGLEWKRVMAANVFTTFKTGPRHDHTTLTANGGHYMLMESLTRQNDDVILTSPIYSRALSLKTACCFQFYYFMYGAGVGDLFVIVKPVSLDLEDMLKNHKDLIKFQKYGNQNNIWNEAHFNIEELDEDFQILIVAKSGRGQLSDIAVDDVKLLTGDDCRALDSKDEEDLSNEEYDSTTYQSIFEMQSCAGRCFESPGSGIIRTLGHLKGLCNCDTDCEDNETCCPDFQAICLTELFEQSTHISEVNDGTSKYEPRKNETIFTQVAETSTTPKTTPKTATNITQVATTTASATAKATIKISTTKKAIPTTISTTTTTIAAPTTVRTIVTTTTIKTNSSTMATTTPKLPEFKTVKTTTKRTTTPTTTTRKTTPITTPRTTTVVPTTIIARQTTPTTTTHKTTATTTTHKTTTPTTTTTPKMTTSTTRKVSTTAKTSTFTRATSTTSQTAPTSSTGNGSQDVISTRRPIPTSKSIDYIINDKPKTKGTDKGSSSLLLYIFFIIVVLILASAVYKNFGDKAVTWYMIRFKQNTNGDDDSSSITTSFKRPQAKTNGTSNPGRSSNGSSKTSWRNKFKQSTKANNIMKTPLVDDDDENDDDDIAANGNIALRNDIYTEL